MKRLKLFLMTLLILAGSVASRAATEMYAVLNSGKLTFYYDGSKASRPGTKYAMNTAGYAPGWFNNTAIKTVEFDSSFKNARPTTCDFWFYKLTNLTSVTGMANLNTSSATSMNSMFYECTSLTSLDVSNINTSKATDIGHMFYTCSALTSLDISKFTLTSSQNTEYMMAKSGLKTLTIPATANVLDQTACSNVGSTSAPCALNYPSGFTPEKMSTGSGWYRWKYGYFKDGTSPTPTTTEAYAVLSGSTLTFYYDKNKASRSGTPYSLNSGTTAPGWNSSATSVTKVVFNSTFASASPTSCFKWFYNMSKLTTITGLNYLKTEKVTNMSYMFSGCSVLTSLDLKDFNTAKVTDMSYMFNGCTKLSNLVLYNESSISTWAVTTYYSNFVTTATTNLRNMFSGCTGLKNLELPDFVITTSKTSTDMFKGCSGLESLHIQGNWTGVNASAFSGVGTTSKPCVLEFDEATISGETSRTPTYFVWKAGYFKDYRKAYVVFMEDTGTLTFCYSRFMGSFMPEMHDYSLNEGSAQPQWVTEFASKVKKVVIEEIFKDARPTSCYQWFANMTGITSITGLDYLNTDYVTNYASMFSGSKKLTSMDISKFKFTSSTNSTLMFNGCSGLKTLTVPATAGYLAADACKGVGTASAPATLNYPSGFTPQPTSTGSGYMVWKSGYFVYESEEEIEGYAVLSGSTLTFYYDYVKNSRSGTKYSLNDGANAPGWNSSATSVTKVVFDSSFEDAEPESCYRWFYNMSKLTSITGINYLNTGMVDNMESMFNGCSALSSIDVSGFDVSSVTTFAYMFNNCAKITGLYTEEWENSVATNMSYMFAGCTNLNGVSFAIGAGIGGMLDYYTKLSTANVTKMDGMFSGCSGLKSLNLAGFNLSKKPSTTNFLKGCSSLEWMHIPKNMGNLNASACSGVGTTSKPCTLEFEDEVLDGITKRTPTYFVWKGGYFEDYRYPIATYDLTTYTLTFWFTDYSGPPTFDIYDYSLNEGSTAPQWLEFASQVKKVEFKESFKDVCPTSCYQWFYNMTNLTAIEGLDNLNTEYVTNMASMFSGCKKLTSMDISKFTITSSTNSKLMLNGCSGLKTLTVSASAANLAADACKGVGTASAPITLNYSGFTPQPTSTGSGYMVWKGGYFKYTTTPTPTTGEMYAVLNGSTLTFYYDYNKSSRPGTKYAMNTAGYAPGWYNNKSIKTVVFDSSFKNARPTTCDFWFYGLNNLTSVTGMANLNTSSATSMNSMFYECTSLTSLDVSNINTSKATDIGHMFYTCSALTSLDISKFTLTSSQNTEYMMAKSGLKTLIIPATANVLDQTACSNVGSAAAPCSLVFPSGFTPEKMSTGSGWYRWKYGYFKDGKPVSLLGDANADTEVNITDVLTIVNYVLDRPIPKFSFTNADMNKDNQIGLVDALKIVDIILGRANAPAKPQFSNQNVMFLSGQGSELDLHLRGTGIFMGAEMTLVLPEGCSLQEAVLNPIRSDGHELLINDLGNGCYRLVVMGCNGQSFGHGETALIHLSLDGNYGNNVRLNDILMTSADLETIAIEGVQGIATGIEGLVIDGSASDGEWYNLQGQRVTSPHHGIYIRNGKKYTVK